MELSIIIVNGNTRQLLADCLRSIYATQHNLSCEIFVVDNASTDDSADMVALQFPRVKLIENQENVGFARANNQAIRLSQGRYILLLNSDTIVQPAALVTLVDFMRHHPPVGAIGPRLLNADGTLQPSCYPMLTPGREFWRLLFLENLAPRATYNMSQWDNDTPRQVEVIKGACLLLRRTTLEQVGMLDERYFMYSEEMDLCYRLLSAGWNLYWVPQAQVTHLGEASSRQIAEEMYLQLYRSKIQFHRKIGGEKEARWFKILLALAYFPRWVIAELIARFIRDFSSRARKYRRLLAHLPKM